MKTSYSVLLAAFSLLLIHSASAQLFDAQQVISTDLDGPRFVRAADLDGDGDMDVLSASRFDNKIAWYENLGGGNFSDQLIISEQLSLPYDAHATDMDGDGDLDVLSTGSGSAGIVWFENQGEGSFGDEQQVSSGGTSFSSAFAADFDSDGDMDVVAGNAIQIFWFENLGDETFGEAQGLTTDFFGGEYVYTVDLDNDGDLDVLAAMSEESIELVTWYENLGDGDFGAQQIISTNAVGANCVYAADLDDDGLLDVLSSSNNDGKIAWYQNLDDGQFGEQQIIFTSTERPQSIHAADLDLDGDMDVLSATYFDDKVVWYENLGDGLFNEPVVITDLADGANCVYTADLDNDGDMDVLSTSNWDNKVSWHENLSPVGCTDPLACNYDPEASIDSENCCYECGCTVAGAVNYSPTACINDGSCQFEVLGMVFFDENENGVKDNGENGIPLQEIEFLPDNLNLTTNDNGQFLFNASGSDSYTFIIAENPLFPYFTTPTSVTLNALQNNWNQDTIYFGMTNELPSFELEANLYSETAGFLCNDNLAHYLCFRNVSNFPVDVQIAFHYDELFQDIILTSLIDSVDENIAYLSFEDVAPLQLICAQVELITPTVSFIGDILESSIEVTATYQFNDVAFETASFSEEVACAYDPNDKHVYPIGYSDAHYIANDTTLEYLIRFQNTGNAPATDVIIRDTLDANLDLSTFQLVANSHPVYTTVNPATREVEFYFQNIMLPDSVNNEPESHGLVSFQIRPEEDLPLLTELNNSAAIYFDNNPPIITNTTWSTIYDCSLFEVNFTDEGALLTASAGDQYQWFLNGEPIEGATEQQYTVVEDGTYAVQVDIDFPCSGSSESTFITVSDVREINGMEIKLFPNPMTSAAVLDLGELTGTIQLEIYDVLGRLQRSERITTESGTLMLERGALSKGSYILRLIHEQASLELKFLVE